MYREQWQGTQACTFHALHANAATPTSRGYQQHKTN